MDKAALQGTGTRVRILRVGRILLSGDVDMKKHSRRRKSLEAAAKVNFGSRQVNMIGVKTLFLQT